ncbi:phage head morphogenesis protein [Candidatus Pacearchaeota archaeon]|nr:phage head morphogenesis protein [Candidatus Pacearchaeota archaeon]
MGDLTDFGRARTNKLLREATAVIEDGYKAVQIELDFEGLAKQQAGVAANSFKAIGLTASLPSETALKALVNGSLIEGAPSAAWWSKQSDDTAFKFSAQVRQGIAGGETVQQIVRRIVGSPRLGTPGIMETSRRGASALVHTSIQQVSNDARLATFKANDDIVKGVMQLSTLDSHTTKICIAYSGASWDLEGNPIDGNELPFNGGTPRHFNCRSVLTPITRTYKELGINIPEAPPGTRASDLGQVPATTTFESFLERHDAEYMDNLLGPGRAKLYRDGKITLTQLVDGQGRPLTLKQLEAL